MEGSGRPVCRGLYRPGSKEWWQAAGSTLSPRLGLHSGSQRCSRYWWGTEKTGAEKDRGLRKWWKNMEKLQKGNPYYWVTCVSWQFIESRLYFFIIHSEYLWRFWCCFITCLFCYRAHLQKRCEARTFAGRRQIWMLCCALRWEEVRHAAAIALGSLGFPNDLGGLASRRRYYWQHWHPFDWGQWYENWRWQCFLTKSRKLPGRGKHCCNGSMGQWRGTWLETL